MKKIKISFNAPVTLSFVGLCFIATLLGVISGGGITESFFMTWHSSLLNPMTYVRFFTHVLGHAGWDHFVGNMTLILLLGPMLEEKYGSAKMVEIICITAVVTAVLHYVLFPRTGLYGASGVVFAFILLASFTGFKNGEIPLSFILVGVIYIGEQVIQGVTVNDNISNMAHIVGGLIGSFAGYKMNVGKKSS